ncbi:MAG: helix-turn-helix transcriptional regulator [Candidatus Woesearchaeota archaeon]
MDKISQDNFMKDIALSISIIAGFLFVVVFLSLYIRESYGVNGSCGCSITMPIVTVLMSILGIFVGTFVYYLLRRNYSNKINKINNNVEKTLNFLESDEKKIIKLLIKENGSINQSKIKDLTKLSAVKISRRLSDLEKREILLKEKNGMTNRVTLTEDYKDIFLGTEN